MVEETKNNILEADDVRPHSSFELKSTSKGVNVKVKIYTGEDTGILDVAQSECTNRFEALRKQYSMDDE